MPRSGIRQWEECSLSQDLEILLKGEISHTTPKRHFIQVLLILAELLALVIRQFLGTEFLHHFPIASCPQKCLKRGFRCSGRLGDLLAAFLTPLFKHHAVSVLLSQTGRRTTVKQISLNIPLMLNERTKAGLQAIFGRLAVSQCAGVNLQGLIFATLTQLPEGRDTGSESFHQDLDGEGWMECFTTACPR